LAALASVFTGLALGLGLLRLWIRVRIRRLWWEDVFAMIAFTCGVANLASEWLFEAYGGGMHVKLSCKWIYMFAYTCVVWAVRISILFSVIRIIPPSQRLHTLGLISIIFSFLLWGGLIIQKAVWCAHVWESYNSSVSGSMFYCSLTRGMSIFELVADCIADLISIALPLHMLRTIKLPRRQRRLLRLLFSATITISLVAFVRMATQVVEALSDLVTIAVDFQVATSLMVCNVLVVVTYLYRVMGLANKDEGEGSSSSTAAGPPTDDDFTTPASQPSSTNQLTTVEFSTSGCSYPTSTPSGQRSTIPNDV
ncbi:hypothetical protein F5I97DRAFT_1799157, partial [Phlebopus sp. FC_14]